MKTSFRILALTLAGASILACPAMAQSPAERPQDLTFRGEVRLRAEWEHPLVAPADLFTLARTRLGASASVLRHTRVLVELQDSRVLGATGGGLLQLHQGYLELAPGSAPSRYLLRAGRQEIALGNERLVGRVNWSNVGRAFDGVRLMVSGSWPASFFVATVEERGLRSGATPPVMRAEDQLVAGAFVSRSGTLGVLDATLLHDRGMRARGREVEGRTTADLRLRSTRLSGFRTELEGAYQVGSQSPFPAATGSPPFDDDISAWLLGARLGTPLPAAGGVPPRLAALLGADVLSGDSRHALGERGGAFHTLFATNHPYYGLMDLFVEPGTRTAGAGLTDLFISTTAAIGRASLRADVHHMSATSGGGAFGAEGDVILSMPVTPAAVVELGYGAFRAAREGARIGLAPEGATRQWSYLQLTASF